MSKQRILFAEDESFGEAVQTFLEVNGFEVSWQESAAAALKAAENFTPDLILLDYSLPDPALKLVRIDSAATESFLAVRADTTGRLFVGCREELVVYEPDDADAEAPALLDLLEQLDAGRAGADDDGERLDAAHLPALAALVREADRDPNRAHRDRAEQEVEQEDRARKAAKAVREHHDGEEERRREQVAARDVLDVVDAHVLPRAPEEVRGPEADELAREQQRQRHERQDDPAREHLEIEAQRKRDEIGRGRDPEMGRDADRVSMADEKRHERQARVAPRELRGAALAVRSARISCSAPQTVSTAPSVIVP